MPCYSGGYKDISKENHFYRIPAEDVNKVRVVSVYGMPLLILDAIKDADGNWSEFSIPWGSFGMYFEYIDFKNKT